MKAYTIGIYALILALAIAIILLVIFGLAKTGFLDPAIAKIREAANLPF